jgi:sulfite reductase alpha subunit-like flavoprotein
MVLEDEAMPDIDAADAGSASKVEDASQVANGGATSTTAPGRKIVVGHHAKYDVDNQGRRLDREAVLFSHVDDSPRRIEMLKYEHQIEDRMSYKHISARLSEASARGWPGGIDILDRPNVLRDAPAKYSLDNSAESADESLPARLLPIPGAWSCVVDGNDRLTPESHWQDVRQLRLRIFPKVLEDGEFKDLRYSPGAVAVIYPKNFKQDVQVLIGLMGWGDVADEAFMHHSRGYRDSTDIRLPCMTPRNCYPLKNSTLRDLLIHNYDITCIPRRTFFTEIAHYTEDPTHKERLREFADPGHSDEFWDYTSRPRRSILEVLQDFPTVRIPYQHVPSVFPVIRGREYSIASGGVLVKDPGHPNDAVVELVVALVEYKTVLRKTRQGFCSRYIASLKVNTPINVTIRENKIPNLVVPEKPLLAIATGTGVAPIRALAYERRDLVAKPPETLLFYGGRNYTADFHFENEWKNLGIQVITAFSRDQPSKIYVQNRLLENYDKICKILRKGAVICLCGSSGQMPEAVRLALYDCIVKGGMATDREHAKHVLHRDFTFWEEVW